MTGFISDQEKDMLASSLGLKVIAYQQIQWTNGAGHSFWTPMFPGRHRRFESPADLWGQIASHLGKARASGQVELSAEERLAGQIRLTLMLLDRSLSRLCDHYHEQLITQINSGDFDRRRSSTQDFELFSQMHAFFLHLGTARDYLGAFIAARLGLNSAKIDDMARLTSKLKQAAVGEDDVLDVLINGNMLSPKSKRENGGWWMQSGWLQEATSLRKIFVHQRPFGSKSSEKFGWLVPLESTQGLYKYHRPIDLGKALKSDALDTVTRHYQNCMELFQDAALATGYNTSMLSLSPADVISMDIKLS